MNTIVYFEIQTSNPNREMKFYNNVFGWKFVQEKNVPIEYYRIQTNGMHGALLKRPAQIPPAECGANAFVCSIEVKDFDKTEKLILANEGKIVLPKFVIPNRCWQGYFADKDNNTFGIFEVNLNAK